MEACSGSAHMGLLTCSWLRRQLATHRAKQQQLKVTRSYEPGFPPEVVHLHSLYTYAQSDTRTLQHTYFGCSDSHNPRTAANAETMHTNPSNPSQSNPSQPTTQASSQPGQSIKPWDQVPPPPRATATTISTTNQHQHHHYH